MDHAIDAYSLRACGYVTKPMNKESIDTAFEQCRPVFLRNARFIQVVSDRISIRIPLVKIVFVEVYGRNVLFHTVNGVIKSCMTLDDIRKELGKPFLHCHRSYLVNMNQIDKLREHDILLKTGDAVPMRQRGRMDIRDAYAGFLTDRLFEVK
jgi:DNA-binding LytR/AlgR family response regulator